IPIIYSHLDQQTVMDRFRITVAPPDRTPPLEEDIEAASQLDTRPGQVEDLLDRDTEQLALDESLLAEQVELPGLDERLASEALERDYDLVQDLKVARAVDAKIIEIAQDDARRDIDVARRFVRPSPTRILEPDETPTLRSELESGAFEPLLPPPPLPSSLGDERGAEEQAAQEAPVERPAFEEDVLKPEVVAPELARLPLEHRLVHAPVVDEIREESAYDFIDDLVDIKLDAYVPPGEEEGYFRLQITPKEGEQVEPLPKDVTFIIDASNSILERKLTLTIRSVHEMVSSLGESDRFNIVVFRDTPTYFRSERVSATPENKAEAEGFLKGIERGGQTDLYQAIRPALEQPPRDGVPGIVLLITDGRPTTGMRDGRTIINTLTAENKEGNTIFAYGGGNTVNQYLLDLLAYRNKGASYVSPNFQDINRDLPRFFQDLQEPILVKLNADYGSIDDAEVFPKEIPDFYRGRVVTVYGRFDPKDAKEFSMRLTGAAGDRSKELVFKADLAVAQSGNEEIARNWAFERIYYLIGEICRVGERPELLSELRHLSQKYKIKTSYD
ncbi:MAG TPA: VWA domain-containing protein, partial [Candidatus Hydrogenedentes bacterium]|nr:VWA domain-containing protein [Candidatus Hydrogenedentota bacterium]